MMEYKVYGETDRGTVRENNEDAFWVDEKRSFFIIADGLGGLPGGEKASETAVKVLKGLLKGEIAADFQRYFEVVREAVNLEGEVFGGDLGIATTLTAGVLDDGKLKVGHVGDSGIFVFRDGKVNKLTTDHTMAQGMREQAQPGDRDYIPSYYNHILTQCIGKVGKLDVEVVECELKRGDRILFYTDGVTKAFPSEELLEMSEGCDTPEGLVKAILAEAEERGGTDNTTAVAIYIN